MKPSLALPAALALHHRLFAPTLPPVPFTERGSLVPADGAYRIEPATGLPDDLAAFSDILARSAADNLYYQLALQRDGQTWDFASVKACHLPQVTSQTIVLHLQDSNPFAIDYYLSPIPHDGSCPKSKTSAAAFVENLQRLNTTVILDSPRTLPLPELRKPQPLTPAGEPVQPVPEKSFIQKYWMYMAIILVAFVFAGGEEEGPRRQAQA